ncbi:hypothetical protein KUM39_10915 [Streptomyces sp. J2-1]|uniref:DUF5954 family protein n=1 Tax=Streptomyces corallincola TaxID=2851888 RepID=UPI001C382670|nr:DUF5954 family protein [Streptomyces corallincola]MBV2354871.1 hypothetical protein [Streptomyces corallincola]
MPPIVVRVPDEPVEAVREADARDAASEVRSVVVRGPLFGVAVQKEGEEPRWRVMISLESGCAQEARDSLHSRFWFRAKDEAESKEERRALLAAVARLETERVDEITVLDERYRIVRVEEYVGMGPGGIELPRPTDPQPAVLSWERKHVARVDEGLLLDPAAPITPSQAAERLALRSLAYTSSRFPKPVLRDARDALRSHPDVMLLPPAFRVLERDGDAWSPATRLQATAHEARKALDFVLTWLIPRQQGLLAIETDPAATARSRAAEDPVGVDPELAELAQASDRLRAENSNELEVQGTLYRICRIRRLVRWGLDGPEGPRPSDVDSHPPEKMHPFMDEDGVVHPERESDRRDDADED